MRDASLHSTLPALLLALALLLPLASSRAQDQPAQAVNQQDEVVTVHLDPSQGAERVLQILRSGDKFETNAYASGAFELRNTTAYELKPYINDIVTREKGFVRGVQTRPSDGSAPRHFLVVTTTPEQLGVVEQTIRTLDVPGLVNSQGRSRVALRARYRRASDLGRIVAGTRGTSQTKIFADDLTNTLYYDDSAYVTEAIEPYIAFFDVPVPQIEFDVQIIEVREDDAAKLGVDWDAWKRSIGGQLGLTANQFEGGDNFARLDSLLTLDANVLANFLNYTTQTGNARLVQRSRLNASNLEPAVISDLKRVPFYDYQRTERSPAVVTEQNPRVDSYGTYDGGERAEAPRVVTIVPPVNNRLERIGEEREGLLIVIQPVIGVEAVTAKIDIALNTVTGFDRQERPIVTEQTLENLFTLQNEKRILLGTLERQSIINGRRGIPGLKEIPVAKYLFSVESRRSERSRLFILATPRFSNLGFEARTLAELRRNVPAIKFEERDIVLEDNGLQAALEQIED